MKETTFGKRFMAKLPEMADFSHGWHMKVIGHEKQKIGIPDWLLCINGRFVGIEFKIQRSNKVALAPSQANELNRIRESGGLGYLIAYCEQSGEIKMQYDTPLPIVFADYVEVKWEISFSSIQNACEFIMEAVWIES